MGLEEVRTRLGGLRVITEVLLTVFGGFIGPLINALPDGNLDAETTGIGDVLAWVAKADTLIPIVGPMTLALGLLSALGAFLAVRLLITMWRQVPFT